MRRIRLGREIGNGAPVFIVAEVGINHQGSLKIAKRLIKVAVEAGADAVKFQKRCIKNILTREMYQRAYPNGGNTFGATYGEHREALELSEADFKELKRYAQKMGIIFFASAWDEESADMLERLDVPIYKIGSPDLTNLPLLRHIAKKGRPVILSTGMSEMWELEEAVQTIMQHNTQLALLHCVSAYPAEFEDLRLRCIPMLSERFGLPVGYSGHERGWLAAVAAVTLGACIIEKHITLDRRMKGSDHAFSLEPDELKEMVQNIRIIEKALNGCEKYLLSKEIPFREKLGKSLVTRCKIPKGTILQSDMLTCKSPARGISPLMFNKVIGSRIVCDLEDEAILTKEDIMMD
jgi:sialic acid synthase SpsE